MAKKKNMCISGNRLQKNRVGRSAKLFFYSNNFFLGRQNHFCRLEIITNLYKSMSIKQPIRPTAKEEGSDG